MPSNVCVTPEEVLERLRVNALDREALLAGAFNSFAHADLMTVLAAEERCQRAAPAALHPILNRLVAEATPSELGGSTMIDALVQRLLISKAEAGRRIRDAAVLGPRHSFTGEELGPLWTATAEGQAAGEIGPEQLAIIRKFIKKVPSWVDPQEYENAEHALAAIARVHAPPEVQAVADLLLLCLNPDGDFSDQDRAVKRGLTVGDQQPDGMSWLSGWITPELRAMLEVVLAVWARYGQCNPDVPDAEKAPNPDLPNLEDVLADFAAAHAEANPQPEAESPTADSGVVEQNSEVEDLLGIALATPRDPGPTPTDLELADHDAAIADTSPYRDTRTQSQRNHDALDEVLRKILSSGVLPGNRGAPTTVVLSMTAQQLLEGGGHVMTATGTWLPFSAAIRVAKTSYPCLAVFDDHDGRPLYLGRGKRIATYDQWLMLFARDRGCCRPGCTIAAAHCQIHHHLEWGEDGLTDVDNMSLECTCDHRLLSLGYTTRIRADGRVEWTPPAHLDIDQPRTNNYFFPEQLLREAEKKRAQQDSGRPPDTG